MDGFLASRSFRRSGKQLDRKSSLLLTPSLTSTRRAKLSICHNSSPDSTFPSSHSIFAAAAPPPAGSPRHRASTGQGWGGLATRATPTLPRASCLPGGAVPWWSEMYVGVPTPARGEPPAHRPDSVPAWRELLSFARLLLAYFLCKFLQIQRRFRNGSRLRGPGTLANLSKN